MIYDIINELAMFFKELYKSIDKVIDKIGENLSDLITAILVLIFSVPFYIIAVFFNFLLRYFKMHQNFIKNEKEFIEFMRSKKNDRKHF